MVVSRYYYRGNGRSADRQDDYVKEHTVKKEQQTDWEWDKIFTEKQPGDIRKEYVTYRWVGAKLHRITVTRIYYGSTDYQDSVESVVIPNQG